MREINKVILHCTDTDLPMQNVAMITQWHLARGFISCGYHWVVLFDGTIEQGRPEDQPGAHTAGHNKDSIGVCLTGRTKFTRAQFAALERLLPAIKRRYPEASLHGHREFNDGKTCPIFDYDWLLELWDDLDE